ncbi:unnamed protein product [Rhodiola kirilowii]
MALLSNTCHSTRELPVLKIELILLEGVNFSNLSCVVAIMSYSFDTQMPT